MTGNNFKDHSTYAAQQVQSALCQQSGYVPSSLSSLNANTPREPKILEVAEGVLKYLAEAHMILAQIEQKLGGRKDTGELGKDPYPGEDLTSKLRRASTSAASLVGAARTIDSLLGE